MKRLTVFSLIFLFSSLVYSFADTSIRAQVDKPKISTDDTLTYKITITSTDKTLPVPQLPGFTNFAVLSQVESSNMVFGKDGPKTTLIYEFVLAPNAAGKFKINPASIKINNKPVSTDSFEIEVTQGKIKPQAPEERPTPPMKGLPESEEPQITL